MMRFPGAAKRWSEGWLVAGGALAIRAIVLLLTPDALATDPDGYRAVGENLLRHGVLGHGLYPTAVRPPLYPLILAGCALAGPAARWMLGLVHLAMGVATVWLTWDLAQNCRMPRWQHWLAAGLVACDPLLLRASSVVMSETLAALLFTAALNLWARYLRQPTAWRAGLCGAIVALGTLCRPEWILGVLAGAGLVLICPTRPTVQPQTAGWKRVSCYLIAAGGVLAPWAIRNALQFGWPVLSTTHGGYTMWLANNRWLYEHLQQGGSLADWDPAAFHQAWHQVVESRFILNRQPNPGRLPGEKVSPTNFVSPDKEDSEIRMVDELGADQWAYQTAWHTIRENPARFCRAVVLRWHRFWQLTPSRTGNGPLDRMGYYGCLAWYGGEFVLVIWGIWVVYAKRKGHPILQNVLLLAFVWAVLLTGVHAFYWTEMRMRSPLSAGLALAAASGLRGMPPCRKVVRAVRSHTPSGGK